MQLALSTTITPPSLPVWGELSGNLRRGFTTKNQGWNPGPNVVNSTTQIGLRASLFLEGLGQSHSARYYNPTTGRFMSRDPEDGWLTNPVTLHKYLYVGGDPVNAKDPTGRSELVETPLDLGRAVRNGIVATVVVGGVACILNTAADLVRGVSTDLGKPVQSITFGFCSATVTKSANCSKQEIETCQKLYEYCSGSQCGSCLSYCTVQCEWPFHRPACNKFKFPKDWKDFPPGPIWIN